MRHFLERFDISLDRVSRKTPAQRVRFMEQEGVSLVIEVGAYIGRYGTSLRANGYAGRIASFEPIPMAFNELRKRTDAKWSVHNLGVGSERSRRTLKVTANIESSSLLPMLQTHLDAAPHAAIQEEIDIEVVTLDSMNLIDRDDTIMLVLDVQGYESEVLRGAVQTLARVRLIEMEMSTTELYEGQDLIGDHIQMLHAAGFDLIWMVPCFKDPVNNRVLQFDGIFARRRTAFPAHVRPAS